MTTRKIKTFVQKDPQGNVTKTWVLPEKKPGAIHVQVTHSMSKGDSPQAVLDCSGDMVAYYAGYVYLGSVAEANRIEITTTEVISMEAASEDLSETT